MQSLYILWTNADIVTSRLMVFMYARNSKKNEWWDNVTVIVWGATAKLIKENEGVQEDIKGLINMGVDVIACKACADIIESSDTLKALGISVEYIGTYLTDVIKDPGKHLITV
jgi:hypothetical protein